MTQLTLDFGLVLYKVCRSCM